MPSQSHKLLPPLQPMQHLQNSMNNVLQQRKSQSDLYHNNGDHLSKGLNQGGNALNPMELIQQVRQVSLRKDSGES